MARASLHLSCSNVVRLQARSRGSLARVRREALQTLRMRKYFFAMFRQQVSSPPAAPPATTVSPVSPREPPCLALFELPPMLQARRRLVIHARVQEVVPRATAAASPVSMPFCVVGEV